MPRPVSAAVSPQTTRRVTYVEVASIYRRRRLTSSWTYHMKTWAVFGLALIFSACGPQDNVGRSNSSNGGNNGGRDGGATCSDRSDTDGDGIRDSDEGAHENPPRDTDHDGTPDYQDNDSDGDG